MLTNTFCHVPGIGEKTERDLWSAGITSWDCAVGQALTHTARRIHKKSWVLYIEESQRQYEMRNAGYFAESLPSRQYWRLYHDFQDSCAFVDIETTGLSTTMDDITTAVLYDGRAVRYYTNGDNLKDLPRDLNEFRLLVTYNGKRFDVPFIECFFGIRLPQAHIDLVWLLRSLGLKGGLKGCERQLEISRPGLAGVDGSMAIQLWNEYRSRKNIKALETLLAYNAQDALSLQTLMVHLFNEKVKATPFSSSYSLPPPVFPDLPFQADDPTVRRLLDRRFGSTNVNAKMARGENRAWGPFKQTLIRGFANLRLRVGGVLDRISGFLEGRPKEGS